MNEVILCGGCVISAVIVVMSIIDVYNKQTREWGEN